MRLVIEAFLLTVGIWLLIIGTVKLTQEMDEVGYKQGQIDCINGKLQYEIKKNEDGSMTWERKEK